MRTRRSLFLVGALVALGSMVDAWARPVRWWTPKELYDKADLVVIGRPSEVASTPFRGSIQLGENNPKLPVRGYRATLRPTAIVKGPEDTEDIRIEYSGLDWKSHQTPVVNGPHRIWLSEDTLFLLYLKRRDDGVYVGVLDGAFDDGQAVRILEDPKTEAAPISVQE